MNFIREVFEDEMRVLNDNLPAGWVSSFVTELKEELLDALGVYAADFRILDCKEKYGQFRLYWHISDNDYWNNEDYDNLEKICLTIENIIKKYEKISHETCMVCGKHTISRDHGLPLCEVHYPCDTI